MSKRLRVIAGADQGCSWELLDGRIQSIGRIPVHNEIVLHDPNVSRIHCEVEVDGERVVIRDLDSSTGTFVNGKQVTTAELRHADLIKVGDTELSFMSISDAAPVRPKAAAAPAADETAVEAAPAPRPAPAAPEADALAGLAGTTLGHYEIGPVLGKGHCGCVFRARDLRADRPVALKVLQADFPKNDEEMQRFIKAIKAVLPLQHPNLVAVVGAGRTGQHVWIAAEFVEGESVARRMEHAAATGLGDWQQGWRAALGLARALEVAHQHAFLHRNITPHNVLLTRDGEVKLADLIVAKALEGSALRQLSLRTKVQSELPYLAPEQTHSPPAVDIRTDLYAVGATVYALLTGRPPFIGRSMADVIAKIRQADPARPTDFDPFVPDAFEAVILKLLAKRPEDRFATAGELAAALEGIGEGAG